MLDRTKIVEIMSGERRGPLAGAWRFCLSCLTPIYRLAVAIRNRRFDRAIRQNENSLVQTATVPVVSIGNLTTGGTGKTPLVIWVAQFFQHRGQRVALISRGYGGVKTSHGIAPNDEALELEHRLPGIPHLQSPDRVQIARQAVDEHNAQLIVLDDGFQHRKIHRNLDVVLIDATRPFGYDRLLPRGLLREPVSSLRRANLVILTRADLVGDDERRDTIGRIREFYPGPVLEIRTVVSQLIQFDGRREKLERLKCIPVLSFCGIGNPDGFQATLKQVCIEVSESLHFPDHHHYSQRDLIQIAAAAKRVGAKAIICTHKDLVKLDANQIGGVPVYALLIDVEFRTGQSELEGALDALFQENSKCL